MRRHTDPRSKGLTEAELTSLGYKETIIFRPGMLRPVGGRDHPRMVEAIAGFFTKNILSHLSDNAEIQTDLLGKAMMLAGEMGIDVCLKNGFGKMTKLGKDGQEVSIPPKNSPRLATEAHIFAGPYHQQCRSRKACKDRSIKGGFNNGCLAFSHPSHLLLSSVNQSEVEICRCRNK